MSVESMIGDETGTVYSLGASAKDAAGGIITNPGTIYSSVPMRDEVTGSRIEDIGGQKTMIVNHRIYTMQSGITNNMHIIFDGMTLRVLGANQRRARSPSIPTWYEIDCEEHKAVNV